MAINPNPVGHKDGVPLYEQDYTDLEDVIIDVINANFDLDETDPDPIDPIEIAAKVMEALFAEYDIVTATPPQQ